MPPALEDRGVGPLRHQPHGLLGCPPRDRRGRARATSCEARSFAEGDDLGTGEDSSDFGSPGGMMFVAMYAPRTAPAIVSRPLHDRRRRRRSRRRAAAPRRAVRASGHRRSARTGGRVLGWPFAGTITFQAPPGRESDRVVADQQNPVALITDSCTRSTGSTAADRCPMPVVAVGLDGGTPVTPSPASRRPARRPERGRSRLGRRRRRPRATTVDVSGSVAWAPFDGGAPISARDRLGRPDPGGEPGRRRTPRRFPRAPMQVPASYLLGNRNHPAARGAPPPSWPRPKVRSFSLVLGATSVECRRGDPGRNTLADGRSPGLIGAAPAVERRRRRRRSSQRPGKLVHDSTFYWGTTTTPARNPTPTKCDECSRPVGTASTPDPLHSALDSTHIAWGEILDSDNAINALFVTEPVLDRLPEGQCPARAPGLLSARRRASRMPSSARTTRTSRPRRSRRRLARHIPRGGRAPETRRRLPRARTRWCSVEALPTWAS